MHGLIWIDTGRFQLSMVRNNINDLNISNMFIGLKNGHAKHLQCEMRFRLHQNTLVPL